MDQKYIPKPKINPFKVLNKETMVYQPTNTPSYIYREPLWIPPQDAPPIQQKTYLPPLAQIQTPYVTYKIPLFAPPISLITPPQEYHPVLSPPPPLTNTARNPNNIPLFHPKPTRDPLSHELLREISNTGRQHKVINSSVQ